jgi:hypothetical protein
MTDLTLEVLAERIAGFAELFDRRFIEADRAVTAALAAAEKATDKAFLAAAEAVNKAEQAQLRVNATQNEFRGTLADQNATTERTMMPRAETELLIRELNSKVDSMRGTRAQGVGLSADVAARLISLLIGAVAVIASVYLATH